MGGFSVKRMGVLIIPFRVFSLKRLFHSTFKGVEPEKRYERRYLTVDFTSRVYSKLSLSLLKIMKEFGHVSF